MKVYSVELYDYLGILRQLVILSMFAWFLLKFANVVDAKNTAGELDVINRTRTTTFVTIFKLSILVSYFMFTMQIFGFSLRGVTVFGSATALILGLAAKTWIENVLGYFSIRANKKYSLGDFIEIPEMSVSGIVESITLSSTNIRDVQTKLSSVPNGQLMTRHVTNASHRKNRQITIHLPVKMCDMEQLSLALKNIKKVLLKDERVEQSKRILSNVTGYNAENGYIEIQVDCFLKSVILEQFFSERQEMYIMVFGVLDKLGIEIAFKSVNHVFNEFESGLGAFKQQLRFELLGDLEEMMNSKGQC
jgi:small-conductance mechanosensitive channel